MIPKVKISESEFNDITRRILSACRIDTQFGSEPAVVDQHFKPVSNAADARWILTDNYYACCLIRIDPDGSLVQLGYL